MIKIISTLAVACLTLASVAAFAQDIQANNWKCGCWYVGAGIGYSKFHLDDTVTPIPSITYTISSDDNDWGGKVFVGYHFNPNFAIEGGYVDLGKASQTATLVSPAAGSLTADFKSRGVFLDAVGIMPLGNVFSIYGKVGGYYAQNSLDFSAAGPITPFISGAATTAGIPLSEDKDELKWKAGLGMRYDFTKNVGIRGEWERYFDLDTEHSGGGTDVDLVSANIIYSF
jgi:OOP family OmpA-OmpF porin